MLYINFEDDRILPATVKDLNNILEAYYELYPDVKSEQKYFFFDEIQNIEHWELFIRRIAEKEKARVFITESSAKLLSKEIATSLRGRTLSYHLYPLSFQEFLTFKNISYDAQTAYSSKRYKIKQLLQEYLEYGGFREVVATATLKQDILSNYFEMIIYKDLVERYAIRNSHLLKMLCKYLITNISSPFSVTSYYRMIKEKEKVSKETLLEYISYLSDINVISLVPIFSYSLKAQQVNPSKVYCIDNGLRNAVALRFSKDEGRLAENLVYVHLLRSGYEVYYWKKHHEVDFVIKKKQNRMSAVNVCYADTINSREYEGLREFKETFPSETDQLLLLTKDTETEENGIQCIPLWKWLLSDQT